MNSDTTGRELRAAILIGGGSGRMGFPKSLLKIGHQFLLERIARAANAVARKIVLVGAGPVPGKLLKMTRLPDAPGIRGPLGGVLSALQSKPPSRWLVFSCDLPFVSRGAVHWLVGQARADILAVLPHLDSPDIAEPLFALYEPCAAEPLEHAARRGERSIRRILAREAIASPGVPDHLRAAWRNVNTQAEWESALAELRRSRTNDEVHAD